MTDRNPEEPVDIGPFRVWFESGKLHVMCVARRAPIVVETVASNSIYVYQKDIPTPDCRLAAARKRIIELTNKE